jgi:2-polyprenyl-3-methyl-5-hydroxy-6-metoxy-1,4-benzoquinol methylase
MEWTQRPGIGPGAEILGNDLDGQRVVELGCGSGHNTAHLASLGADVIGIDSSRGQIRRATGHYGHTGAEFLHSTASAYLNRDRDRLDAIVSVFGAIGLTEPFKLLYACSRRLGRRGVLAFSVPHPQRTAAIPAERRTREQMLMPDGTATVVERWEADPAAWVRALNRAGLLVTGMHHLFVPAPACWPTTLLITARKP